MKISLCMIVKNEEKQLENCLRSITPYVDEIIVMDTGSTDNTIEIAKKYRAKVYEMEWMGDFSYARNQSMQYAEGEWVLVLDADESVMEWDDNLRDILQKTKYDAFTYEMIQQKETVGFHHTVMRLFRNHINIQYKGKIHEQVMKNGKPLKEEEVGHINGKILHVGYHEDVVEEKEKDKRNLSLLLQELKEHPNDILVHFHLANQYVKIEDYMRAMYHYKIATQNKQNKEVMKSSILKMIWSLYKLERFYEMFTLLEEGKRMFPDYTDLYYTHAEVLEQVGHEEEAIVLYQMCMRVGEASNGYYSKKGIGTILPFQKLANIYRKQLRFKEEMACLQSVCMANLSDKEFMIRYFELLGVHDGISSVPFVIDMLYQGDETAKQMRNYLLEWHQEQLKAEENCTVSSLFEREVVYKDLEYLVMKGHGEVVMEYLLHKEELDIESVRMLAELSLLFDLPMQSIQYANQMIEKDNRNFRGIDLLLICCEKIGETKQAKELAKEMIRMMPYDSFFKRFL